MTVRISMMICIGPGLCQYVLTVCVSMMICTHPAPWQYIMTVCVLHDDLYTTLALAVHHDRTYLHDDLHIPLASAIHQIVCISITIRIYPSPQQYIMTVCLHDDLYIPLAVAIRLDRMCLCDNDLHWSKGVAYVLIYISHWYVYRDVTFLILQVHGDLMNQFWKEIKIHNAVCSPKLYMMGSKVLKIQTLIHMT